MLTLSSCNRHQAVNEGMELEVEGGDYLMSMRWNDGELPDNIFPL